MKTPNAGQFREFLKSHELTGSQAAELVGIKPRQIRRYTAGDAPVPYAVWYTLKMKMERTEP